MDDDDSPDIELSYFAEEEEDTCSMEPEDPNCDQEMWWTSYIVRGSPLKAHFSFVFRSRMKIPAFTA